MRFDLDNRDGSDTESDDERFTRLRTRVGELVIPELPSALGLRQWLATIEANCCAASNRSRARTLRYFRRILDASDVEELESLSKRWEPFDAALTVAVKKITSGAVQRELLLYYEACTREGKVATGAASLYMILRRYEVERGQAMQIDINTLLLH